MRQMNGKAWCYFCLARQEYENNDARGSCPANYASLCENELDSRMILMITVFTHDNCIYAYNLVYVLYA